METRVVTLFLLLIHRGPMEMSKAGSGEVGDRATTLYSLKYRAHVAVLVSRSSDPDLDRLTALPRVL